MKKEELKKAIRNTIIGRNTVERMSNSTGYKSPIGKKYVNEMAVEVMTLAKKRHPLFPYYLVTRKF